MVKACFKALCQQLSEGIEKNKKIPKIGLNPVPYKY
jgi:hypothetical protein